MTDPRNAEADVPSESKLKRGMPLVPADSIAGRAGEGESRERGVLSLWGSCRPTREQHN